MEEPTKVIIRDPETRHDYDFIYATWRNALWFTEKRKDEESDQFYSDASEMISNILKRPNTHVKIACLADDHDMLLGWSVMQGQHLEFVYVKWDYRRCGIGAMLTHGFTTFADPQTRIGKALAVRFHKEKSNGRTEEAKVHKASEMGS